MKRRVAAPLIGWAAFAAWYFLFAFQPGIVRSDDFGYLRSVLGTLRAGRPFTDDWLEPYAAVFSSACALLYRLTGRFILSTWGLQALCALVLYPLLYRLFASRLRPRHAALLTLAVATFPVLLAKEGDFHAGICTLDLFLVSLLLFETGHMGWFFAAAFLAFANRQNQVCLLILPLWMGVVGRPGPGANMPKVILPLLYAAAVAALIATMNGTYASAHVGYRHAGLAPLAIAGFKALVAGCLMSLAWLSAFSLLTGNAPGLRRNKRRWIFPAVASLVLLAFLPWWNESLLRVDTPMFGYLGWPQVNRVLPWLLLASFWFLDVRLLRPSPYLALIGGYILIASLRGIWWDYYFMEIAVLGLLLALQTPGAGRVVNPVDRREPAGMDLSRPGLVFLGVLLAANLAYAYLLKVQSDKQRLAVTVLENLDRQGRVSVDRMTGATFGYLGWKLFGYFTAHEGRSYGELADFLGYVRKDRVVVETELPWRRSFKTGLPPGAEMIESGFHRIGFATLRYRVVDLHGAGADTQVQGRLMTLDPSAFHSPRYPLNDREWQELADSLRKR
ncbi:MAG: hypothetical protein JWO30_2535 [Fibrobacteres bacterium]|nr:hypothetical protein [Fibrobacterota bacterium]